MKKQFVILVILTVVFISSIYAKSSQEPKEQPTTIGKVIYSNDTETVWNALRLANYLKNQGDSVNIFLLGKGVDLDRNRLKSSQLDSVEACPISTMVDCVELVVWADNTVTF